MFQIVGLFIGVSWFGSVAMYCVLILPEKSFIFNKAGIRVMSLFEHYLLHKGVIISDKSMIQGLKRYILVVSKYYEDKWDEIFFQGLKQCYSFSHREK